MFEVDLSDLRNFTSANVRAVDGLSERSMRRLQIAVAKAKKTKTYVDRTHHLSSNTEIRGQRVGNEVDVDIVADAHYYSYLEKRGFTDFGQIVSDAMSDIDDDVKRLDALAQS